MSDNGWTPERRARQAELIKQWQPWKQSTGAKTAEGKARSSRNAFKGGFQAKLRAAMKEVYATLREQKEFEKRLRLNTQNSCHALRLKR